MDVHAKLSKKELVMRNKKEYKEELRLARELLEGHIETRPTNEEGAFAFDIADHARCRRDATRGSISYVKHSIVDGNLENILYADDRHRPLWSNEYPSSAIASNEPPFSKPPLLVTSLHSCGNLLHHGLRSITMNPSVRAVAMIGCCYNLMTERLGPATYKHPDLRPHHPRLEATGNACDPHGFPMSRRLEGYTYPSPRSPESSVNSQSTPTIETGIRLEHHSAHDGRASPAKLGPRRLRRFLHSPLLPRPPPADLPRPRRHRPGLHHASRLWQYDSRSRDLAQERQYHLPLLQSQRSRRGTTRRESHRHRRNITPDNRYSAQISLPLLPGIRPRRELQSSPIPSISTLSQSQIDHFFVKAGPDILTLALIDDYETRFAGDKKRLSIMWSLMAFSAGVIESLIVVDRWLWLREQDCVDAEKCWVEAVFEYERSPRNLVVVGVKKAGW